MKSDGSANIEALFSFQSIDIHPDSCCTISRSSGSHFKLHRISLLRSSNFSFTYSNVIIFKIS
uniref:Uncharacterized protein n=1 Tax=Siphoviridae sp. ctPAi1 TaxID=2826320 RepID=A0A8S5M8C7_9CAUD|nr:MAG TPA: hypothetical protein [Siphoviridae sp. ctPAi1]